ncbi:MAG: formylglycine-generating enzyme family protein [Candidatus Eisenbacteria bacterium]|uniref:Formylglycine-generating enzyme family protein n=1 Tax=Eiseniibacteriota bacterium TaxID=2212470 RepID=A0A948RYV1_UNCEI|nr:formylglycine-generating enzyme family protein [Candidatus Eisenbacteria bacterium]MBU1949566.1 formylglycine-generating enzyme family protein [Candidatus Eisenbacteria bacterium]MBU2692099.1 formylglycine-generating enzyme family protein [Candidatus Eisenbacteria bacterium]
MTQLLYRVLWMGLMLSIPLFIAGCSEEDNPEVPELQLGTIVMDPSPDGLNAPWALTGPGGYNASGAGDSTVADLALGDYTISWGAVERWIRPFGETQTLMSDSTLTFIGAYIENTGTIIMDPSPDDLDAPWTLTGPGGYSENGAGDEILNDLPPGDYTVSWNTVSGWNIPSDETRTLAAEDTTIFRVAYIADSGVSGDFVLISAGVFTMGSPADEPGRDDDETEHPVTLTRGFYISKYEVTEQWWDDVMGTGSSTSALPKNDLSWDDAVAFCNALSNAEGLTAVYTINGSNGYVTWNQTANGYRLPTDAEWEYACRAGSATPFANGRINNTNCNDTVLNEIGWYCGNSNLSRHDVGQLIPNAWGLYDMHGNLWEWCYDGYISDYEILAEQDPVFLDESNGHRVIRGGDWRYNSRNCRSASRHSSSPIFSDEGTGLRPVRSGD